MKKSLTQNCMLAVLMIVSALIQPLSAAPTVPFSATASVTDLSCNNDGSGKIVVHATGGTAPYQYALDYVGNYQIGFYTVDSFTQLSAGNYIITVADAAGSSVTINATLTQPTPLLLGDSVTNTTLGRNNGVIDAIASGGTAPYRYTWSTGAPSAPADTGLAQRINYYNVTVTDTNGCQAQVFNITVGAGSSALTATLSNGVINGCYPTQTLNIDLTASGGTTPYLFSVDGGPYQSSAGSNYNFNSLSGQIHTFSVKDAGNVVVTLHDTFTAVATAPITVTGSVTNASLGLPNGSITLTVTGGTPSYGFNWEPSGASTLSNSFLSPDYYTIQVLDSFGCYVYYNTAVNDTTINTPLSAYATVTPNCVQNFSSGTITVHTTGGRLPYLVEVDSGGFTPGDSLSQTYNENPGTHTVTVKDARDSVVVLHVTILNDNLNAVGRVTNTTGGLSNGAVTLTVIPGYPPYSYSWSDFTTNLFDTGQAAGTDDVQVTDSVGCMVYQSFTIGTGSSVLSASVAGVYAPTSCNQGFVVINASGGTQPYLDGFGNPFDPTDYLSLNGGVYNILIIDAANDTVRVHVTVPPAPAPLAVTYTTTPAYAATATGSVTAHVSGGSPPFTYGWSMSANDSAHVGGIITGTYFLTVTDSNSCQYYLTVNVYDSTGDPFIGEAYSVSNSPCDTTTGYIGVDVAGGTTPYAYSIGSGYDTSGSTNYTFSGVTPGIYPVTVIDAAGDTFRSTITYTGTPADPPLNVTGTVTNATGTLDNGAISVQVTGGSQPYTYSWSGISDFTTQLTGQGPGYYYIQVTDSLGCSQYGYFQIDTGSSAFSASATVTNSPCLGQASITAVASGGAQPYSFQINGGGYQPSTFPSFTFNNLNAGTYTINIMDATGAILTLHETVAAQTDMLAVTATVTNATTGSSANGAIVLHVTGGVGYVDFYWPNDGTTLSSDGDLTAGYYDPYVYDSLGCALEPAILVGVGSNTLSASVQTANISCYGDSTGWIYVVATGTNQPFLYEFESTGFSSNNYFTGLPAGAYTVTVKDATGATTVVHVTITQPASPLTVTGYVTDANGSLANGAITLTVSGGTSPYTTQWSDLPEPETDRTDLYAGTYDVGVVDSAGCQTYGVFTIDSGVTARVSLVNVTCYGDSNGSIHVIATGGTPAYSYRLGNGSYQSDSVFTGLPAGTYTVTVKAAGGDSSVVQQVVAQPAALSVSGSVTNTTGGQSNGAITLTVSGGTQPYTYNWGNSITTANRTSLAAGNYDVTVTDSAGCALSEPFTVAPSGITNLSAEVTSLSLQPNPASSFVEMDFTLAADEQLTIRITNELGQDVYTSMSNRTAGQNKMSINTQAWASGMYIVEIGSRALATARLVVVH